MNETILLENYYTNFKSRDWVKAIAILNELLALEDDNHWIYTSLSSCYYELKDYDIALNYVKKAYKINPSSPLVIWDFAGVLLMLNKKKQAIKMWEKILSLDDKVIAFELTTAGLKWAISLKNDCYYRIAQANYYLGNDDLALKYVLIHLENRKKGQYSLYKKKEVLIFLKKLG